ncbi:XK-related protein 5 [Trichosurus vulpecula]|uniref:XK-related protein 5 n=1 Tax=Trichosurus vulpecula TaxID=9337 RepID=UPI00186B3395|nr:XK-related protein 5 [Trichosurus vulpecula]
MHAGYLVLCALLLAAEQGARLCTVVYYFYTEQYLWAWLTVSALLPGCLLQGLSYLWFLADGHQGSYSLVIVHLLQLGIWKRHWDAFLAAMAKEEEPPGLGKLLLQQGDLFVLRLLEALLQMGPHLLLQTYAFVAADLKDPVPGVSAVLSWSSLSLSLVSYARVMCLMKPGHLSMPWAALLCQLLWRLAMLGTRIITLVLFSQTYHCWVLVVGGAHWLVMTFWLVAQQSDIIDSTCCWRLFNLLVGAVYVFCYINFWDSPSRNRMTTFYMIMLMENIVLLLLATDFLQGASWGTMWMTAGIVSGFIIGCASLIIYYSQLHPKSTEIWQGFIKKSCGTDKTEKEPSSFHCANPVEERSENLGLYPVEDCKTPYQGNSLSMDWGVSLRSQAVRDEATAKWHHHWLLVKLALKTGNMSKINAAFGNGGLGCVCLPMYVTTKCFGPQMQLSFSEKEFPLPQKQDVTTPYQSSLQKDSWAEDVPETKENPLETSSYITLSSSQHDHAHSQKMMPVVAQEGSLKEKWSIILQSDFSLNKYDAQEEGCRNQNIVPWRQEKSDTESPIGQVGGAGKGKEDSTFYFSATMEGAAPCHKEPRTSPQVSHRKVEIEKDPQSKADSNHSASEPFPVTMANISPILGTSATNHLWHSTGLYDSSQCSLPGVSSAGSRCGGPQELWRAPRNHYLSVGTWLSMMRSKLRPSEEPCFTSTPKSEPRKDGDSLRERLRQEESLFSG